MSRTDWHTEIFGDSMPMLKKETTAKLAWSRISTKEDNIIQVMDSRCKVKHVRFNQHRETVHDLPSCWWSLQFKEVLHSNPARETQRDDLPYGAEYPTLGNQTGVASLAGAVIGTRDDNLI